MMHVPATPAIEGIDIRTLYDVDHATLLGKGGFSEVLAVRHVPTNELRALKVMNRSVLTGKRGEMVAHEKEILRRTCHPNIVTLYETIQNNDYVYFALDLMNEDLFEFIVRNKRINETLTRKIVYAILSAVAYLHEQSIVHRDIKPENILINIRYTGPMPGDSDGDAAAAASSSSSSGTGGDRAAPKTNIFENVRNINDINPDHLTVDVKIADFGLAKLVAEWDVKSTPCGTSFYIAPEVIRGIEEQGARPLVTTRRLVKSVDIWSTGVVLYVLLCGRPPFHGPVKTGEERRALLRKIDHGVLFNPNHGWDNISDDAKDLIERMLTRDVSKRTTAADCFKHPFFANHGMGRPTPGGDPAKLLRQQQQLAIQRARLQQQQQQQQQQMQQQHGHHHNHHQLAAAAGVGEEEEDTVQEGSGTFIVGEGCPSAYAHIQQQQQQQQQQQRPEDDYMAAPNNAAVGGHHLSGGSSSVPPPRRKKDKNIFSNVKYFFTGGGGGAVESRHAHTASAAGSASNSNNNVSGGVVGGPHKKTEEDLRFQAELEALRKEVLDEDDAEGETTAYKPTAPLVAQKPVRPAMMNPHAKLGPGALKK